MANLTDSIIDWGKFDASSDISRRLSGVTKENLEAELWEQQLKLLEPLDYNAIRAEIYLWKIEIPASNQLYFDNIAMTYSRLTSYKLRVSYLLADAKAWRDTCESAIKYIEDLAPGAFSGTGADKKSNSMHVIQPFVHLKNQTARLENYLEKINSAIGFCSQQLDLLLKERQSQAKQNNRLAHEGEERFSHSSFNQIEEETIEEIVEDGDETFQLINSSKNKIKLR